MLAFPSAEGFGKYTVGGRGGYVYAVTNLNDSGPGSLREALASKGPRTIVFRVSGTIELKKAIDIKSYTTIAGQTAPGDGITLHGWPVNFTGTEIIMRYFRARLGDGTGYENDALHGVTSNSQMILDHLSASWSVDETLSIYNAPLITLQWCLIAESLDNSIHPKGPHGYGGLQGGPQNTLHHNLYANHSSRSPRFKNDADFRNNVIYNWVINSSYGGADKDSINVVNNYYKAGPATPAGEMSYRIAEPFGGKWFVTGNYVDGYPNVTADNWDGGIQGGRGVRMDTPAPYVPIKQQSAKQAFESVLQHAGASFPKRDAIDERIVREVREGTGIYGNNGIIDTPSDVGGLPELKSAPAPLDTDNDGMPDSWEIANGLNPNDSEDRNGIGEGGYTHVEIYINSLVAHLN